LLRYQHGVLAISSINSKQKCDKRQCRQIFGCHASLSTLAIFLSWYSTHGVMVFKHLHYKMTYLIVSMFHKCLYLAV
jgi:hypothetical protein